MTHKIQLLSYRVMINVGTDLIEATIPMPDTKADLEALRKLLQETYGPGSNIDFTYRDLDNGKIKTGHDPS